MFRQYVLQEATADKPKICDSCDPECLGECRGPVSLTFLELFQLFISVEIRDFSLLAAV